MTTRQLLAFAACAATVAACDPSDRDDAAFGSLPAKPEMRVEILAENPNRVVVEDLSEGFFSRVWDLPGATPASSTKRLDTVLYTTAGDYEINLYASASGGAGAAVSSSAVSIEQDAEGQCDEESKLLTGGCEEASVKCWTFSRVEAAVKVGPVPGSGEYYTSPEDGLQDEQYDDSYCFSFSGSGFEYRNNGLTVFPDQGFTPLPYDPPPRPDLRPHCRRRRGRRDAHRVWRR